MVATTTQEYSAGTAAHLQAQCVLTHFVFDNVVGENVDLRGARLSDCVFRGAVLIGADLSDAVLDRVQFVDCHLAGARFANTQLESVTFSNCNLSGSRFQRTSMDRVELDHVERTGWRCDEALWHRFPGFVVEKLLGGGCDARTFRAKRRGRVKPVALKVYKEAVADLAAVQDRVVNHEGPLARRIRSPHVAKVVGFGVEPRRGLPFLATEYLAGGTLAEAVRTEAWHVFDDATRIRLFREMAAGLAAIHRGATGPAAVGANRPGHGNIKPSNIFLADEGKHRVAKLIDFGAAGHARPHREPVTHQSAPRFAYDPPEVILGGEAGGPPGDLYAIGITLYETFAGKHPYLSRIKAYCEDRRDGVLPRAEVVKLINETVPRMSFDEVTPTRLRPILRRCMQVIPKLRYADGMELESALGTL